MKTEIKTTENISDKTLVEYLDVMGISPKITEQEKIQFLNIAKSFGLNPFKREIFCTVYGEGQYKQLSIITGYEVYIKRAERSGQLDGWSATTSGSVASGDLKATVTIYRKDRNHPFVWEAYYNECVQKTKAGVVTKFWEKANFMTKKVAISQGFRLCFSDELGGMPYTADEMPSHEETQDIQHIEVKDEPVAQIEIPKMTEKQFEKAMNANLDGISATLRHLETKKMLCDTEQYLMLQNKEFELKEALKLLTELDK